MQTLTLSDGTVFENSESALTRTSLFLYIRNGMSMAEVFAIMNDPARTETITYSAGEKVLAEYEGYTNLVSISAGVNGLISVVMCQ